MNYSTLLELSAAQNQFCRIRTLEASHWGTRTKTQQTDGIYIPYSNTNACKMGSVQVNQDGRAKKKQTHNQQQSDLLTWDHFHHQRKSTLTSCLLRTALDYLLSKWSCPKEPLGSEPKNTIIIKLARSLLRVCLVTERHIH